MSCWDIVPLPLPCAFSSRLKQYTPLLASIRWRRRKTARHRRQAPLLHISFDEDEAALTEIDVDGARAICADSGEKVLGFEAMGYIVELLAVAGEEDCASAGAIANTYHVALDIGGAVICGGEGLVVAAGAGGGIGY